MRVFPDIVVDPYLVWLPCDCQKVEQLDQFVENLLAWSELLRRDDVNVLFPQSCLEPLVLEDHYPYGYKLKRLATRLGADHLSDDLVCRVAQGVLERTSTLEERCSINIVIFDEGTCRVQPEVYVTRLAVSIGWGLKHALAVIACFQQRSCDQNGFLVASATSLPEEAFQGQEVQTSMRVDAVDCTDANEEWARLLPLNIDNTVPVAFGSESFLKHLGCLRLWGVAESPEQARDAINARVSELLRGGTGEDTSVRTFRFGGGFLASARRHSFGSRSDLATNLIDSCARILLGVPKNPVNPFRVGEHSAEQRKREDDGALAYRTHLTKAGPGYRLMYWNLADSTIEFANVGTKSELEIL